MQVKIKYKNCKGETGEYTIIPIQIWFGETEYHPERQWLLKANKVIEQEKHQTRDFAMKDILAWWTIG